MTDFNYYTSMDIGSAFRSKVDVGEFVEFVIKQVNKLYLDNDGGERFYPSCCVFKTGSCVQC